MATVKTKIGTEESARKLRVEPTGGITATNTQKALEGLDTAKIAATGTLTTHAMLVATGAASAGTLGLLTDGQLMVGQTGADPLPKTLTGVLSLTAAAVVAFTASAFANPSASVGLTAVNGSALTAMRSDAAPALSQTIAPTWTGNHTFSPTTGTAIAINPATNTYNRAITSTQTGPTSGSTAGPIAFNLIQGTASATVTGSGVGQDGLNNSNNVLLKVRYLLGGTNWQGQASAAGQFTASVSNGAGNASSPDAVGLGGSAYINVSNPSTTAGIFGVVPFVYVDSGGSISQAVGSEIDVWVATGGVATQRVGLRIRAQGNIQSTGGIDSAFVVDNFGVAGSAWKNLITISKVGSGIIPLDTTASLFTNDAAMTVTHVFNMSTVTVSGNILSFPNAQLTGAGQLGLGVAASASPLNMSVSSTTANGVTLQNTNTGGIASFTATNDAGNFGDFGVRGTLRATYGALVATDGYAYSNTSLTLMADNASGAIKFAAGGNAERGRFDTSGNLLVGITSAPSLGDTTTGVRLSIQGTGGTNTSFGYIQMMNSLVANNSEMGRFTWGSATFSGADKRTAVIRSLHMSASTVNPTGDIEFFTNNAGTLAEAMRVQPSGGLSVGLTTDPGVGKITVLTAYNVGASQVVAARITGYTAMTGSPDKATAYATGSVTLPQLAGRVAQLQADLTTHGLIGA